MYLISPFGSADYSQYPYEQTMPAVLQYELGQASEVWLPAGAKGPPGYVAVEETDVYVEGLGEIGGFWKKLRKWKPLKSVAKIAPFAASLVPGGALVAKGIQAISLPRPAGQSAPIQIPSTALIPPSQTLPVDRGQSLTPLLVLGGLGFLLLRKKR